MNEVLKAIEERRSIRAYTSDPVTDEQLQILIDAAKQAPSARNIQPCHFSFVRDRALLEAFSKDMNSLYQAREDAPASLKDPSYDVLYHAPLVCFVFSEVAGRFTPVDAGIAVQTLALAVHSLSLGSVILGMPREIFQSGLSEKWLAALKAPEGSDFLIAIAIGTPASSKDAHPVRAGLVTII